MPPCLGTGQVELLVSADAWFSLCWLGPPCPGTGQVELQLVAVAVAHMSHAVGWACAVVSDSVRASINVSLLGGYV